MQQQRLRESSGSYKASAHAQPAKPYPPVDLGVAARILAQWQKALRLEDWDITVRVGSLPDNVLGQNNINHRIKRSLITVPPEHFQRWCEADWIRAEQTPAQALEWTIVHELVHIFGYPDRLALMSIFDECADEATKAALYKVFDNYEEHLIEMVVRSLVES